MGNKTSAPVWPPNRDHIDRAKAKVLEGYDTGFDVEYVREDVALVVADCYNDIESGTAHELYLGAVITAVFNYNVLQATTGEEIKEGLEQLISLASATIRGEKCAECEEEFECPFRVAIEAHDFFAEAIEAVHDAGKGKGLEWTLSNQAKFALEKLILVCEWYHPLRHLTNDWDRFVEELEEMWCHKNSQFDGRGWVCSCWDQAWQVEADMDKHDKFCPLNRW